MALNGPIVIIDDDDDDDRHLIGEMLTELHLPNAIRYFENGEAALGYLLTTTESPLLILCDINMPVMNGLELRDRIDADPYLKEKSIPFIFLSTSDEMALLKKAYAATIQGFFKKWNDFQEGIRDLQNMVSYWKRSLHPNNRK
jgi:CheY-like chemotaxis protein